MSIMMFTVFILTSIVSIMIYNETFAKKMFIILLSISTLVLSEIFMIQAIRNRKFLKMIQEKYHNYTI